MTSAVYVMRSERGAVKIGYSVNPAARRDMIQADVGCRVELAHYERVPIDAARTVEQLSHRMLRQHRLHGEWFDVDVERAKSVIVAAMNDLGIDPTAARPAMGGAELVQHLTSTWPSVQQAAKGLGVSARNLYRMTKGETPVPPVLAALLRLMSDHGHGPQDLR